MVEMEIPHTIVVALDRQPVSRQVTVLLQPRVASESGLTLCWDQLLFYSEDDDMLVQVAQGGWWMPQPWQCPKPGWIRP